MTLLARSYSTCLSLCPRRQEEAPLAFLLQLQHCHTSSVRMAQPACECPGLSQRLLKHKC
ncbi:hypothetical protein ACOSP7_006339 [Xanthoceras sorbifolium]